MKKIRLTILLSVLCYFAQAQMGNPLYSGKLPFGNWRTSIRFDSLQTWDTLVLKNDNQARRYQLNFSDSGKVTWYDERVDAGSTSLEVFEEWQPIGTWEKKDGKVYVYTTLPEPESHNKKNKTIVFSVISESYTLVKMKVLSIGASK